LKVSINAKTKGVNVPKKAGRPIKDPGLEKKKIIVSVPIHVLKMLTGNRTEFINRAIMEKLVRNRNIK